MSSDEVVKQASALSEGTVNGFELKLGLRYGATVHAEAGSEEAHRYSVWLSLILRMYERRGHWVNLARCYVSQDGHNGDCLYVPPACLLDLDEFSRALVKPWRLMIGHLSLENGEPFTHAWLEIEDCVVSVSNLRNGQRAYAAHREDYYLRNAIQGSPLAIAPRTLRTRARQLEDGNALSKWLYQRHVEICGEDSQVVARAERAR